MIDESGVSGTGLVAEGNVWHDGTVSMKWRTRFKSIAYYDSVSDLEAIHGHHGKTRIIWGDPDGEKDEQD